MTRHCLTLGFLTAVLAAPGAEIVLAPGEVRIGLGETRRFEFGTVPQAETTVLLEITSRLDHSQFAGSMYFLTVVLNGHEVQAAKSRSVVRLGNRPLVSPVAANLPYTWYGAGGWRVLYAPDFEGARRLGFYEGDPYATVLDVTDLTNPAAENRLEITNTANRSTLKWAAGEGDLVIRRLAIVTQAGTSPTLAPSVDTVPVINRGEPAAGPAPYRGEVLAGGGFALRVGDRRWAFSSVFSYPNAGLNRLEPDPQPVTDGQPGWHLQVVPGTAGGLVQGEGPDYSLRRTIRFTARKVEVEDALTNRHADAALGLLVRHQVALPTAEGPAVRLAGNPDPAVNEYYSPANPSVHLSLPDQGLGLLCEDDVCRSQARLFCATQPAAAGLRTDMLRLGPGETYALRWSVYPVAGPDYFDFINLVRQDWGANVRVDGAWTFFDPDTVLATPVETLAAQFSRLGIRYACYCGGWVDRKHDRKRIGFGTGVFDEYWADFRTRLRDAAVRLRQAVPGLKVLVYYDSQRDTAEGGHERFADSWLTDPKGNQLSTEWSGVYSLTWSTVATLTNGYGKAMLSVADRYLTDLGVDGLYWDEMENVAYGAPLLTYNTPDGHSCSLDRTRYTIERELGITTLLGEPHRLEVIARVQKQGGRLMGNGPPSTRAILATGVPRMVEIQHNETWCYEGNLATPLGYMGARLDWGNMVRALRQSCLPVGTRYTYEYEIPAYLFPFTPLELHHGYLLGEERLITLHSGRYGWPGQRCLVQVHHFDNQGKRSGADFATTIGAEARTEVKLGPDEALVLERLPVAFDPAGTAPADVCQVHYSEAGLSLRLTAVQGGILRVRPGRFPLPPDAAYTLQVGEAEPQPATVADGAIAVTLPPGPPALLHLRRR